jgi:hypothetical protein
MLSFLRDIRVESLETIAVMALLGSLMAAMAGLRKAWRIARDDADGTPGSQLLINLTHHSVETMALTFLIVFTVLLIGLLYWSTLPNFHATSPALI